MNAGRVKALLERVQDMGHQKHDWMRLLSIDDIPIKRECLRRVVTIILTDEPVKRTDLLFGSSATCPAVGDWEGNGLVQCEVQVSDTCLPHGTFCWKWSITAVTGGD